jgi:hypothetical protein
MAERENPLDIDYSLRIGTSLYHVLGKRRKGRKTKYDYYVMDDKLVRSKSNRKSSRPRYIVDDPDNEKKKPPRVHSASPKRTQVDAEEMKKILDETMDAEREKIVVALRAAVAEENEAAYQANRDKDRPSTDLIKRTVREALNAQKESSTSLEVLEERLVQTIEREFQKDKERSRKEEEERIKRLFAEQKQALTDALNEQQLKATATSLGSIKEMVAEALHLQKEQEKSVSHRDIQELENRLTDTIQKMANPFKGIKLTNDLDLPVLSSDALERLRKKEDETKHDSDHTDNRSSTKQRQASANSPTQEKSTVSHKRDKNPELDEFSTN